MSFYKAVAENRKSVSKLAIGMSKDEVLKIMGTEPFIYGRMTVNNPYRVQRLQGSSKVYQVVYYVTSIETDDNIIDENELTPFIFSDGKLIGWGWSFMEGIR
jgi:hypothetical protein